MRRIVDVGQMLEIQMGIDLCGGDVGVAQQFLHAAQVAAGFQQVAGEGMAQQMGMQAAIDALLDVLVAKPLLHGGGMQRSAALAYE